MKKDFDGWSGRKKELHKRSDAPFYCQREVWWCALGINIGFEQDGSGIEYYRPIIILRGLSRQTCLVVPLTTSTNDHPLRPRVGIIENKEARALLSQIRVIDTKRLIRKMGYVNKSSFEKIQKAAKDML